MALVILASIVGSEVLACGVNGREGHLIVLGPFLLLGSRRCCRCRDRRRRTSWSGSAGKDLTVQRVKRHALEFLLIPFQGLFELEELGQLCIDMAIDLASIHPLVPECTP